jgi:hypothetical protein
MAVVRYGQYCPVAMTAELLCTRWTMLVIRELLCGSGCAPRPTNHGEPITPHVDGLRSSENGKL